MTTPLIQHAFNHKTIILPIERILPIHKVEKHVLDSAKFKIITNSIKEIGIIEPLIVYPESSKHIEEICYILLDGHLRLEALKTLGGTEAVCLISTDNENFTYNRQINRISAIQEYRMIINAIEKGASTERIAKVLNVNIEVIKSKLNMLNGIVPEVVIMLKDRIVNQKIFAILRKMKPLRQIEVVEMMIAANRFSQTYAELMLEGTRPELLAEKKKIRRKALSPEMIARMQQEMEQLQANYSNAKDTIGETMLSLVVAKGYISKLLSNTAINRYISQYHKDVFENLNTVMDEIAMTPRALEKE